MCLLVVFVVCDFVCLLFYATHCSCYAGILFHRNCIFPLLITTPALCSTNLVFPYVFVTHQAIKIAAQATMRMRPETISRAHFDLLHATLDPLISSAPVRLQQQEAQNIAEDRLSLLYTDLIPPGMLVKPVASQSLAQRLKNMSHVNLGGVSVARQSSNDTGDEGSDCDSASEGRASSSGRGSMGRSGSVGRAPSSGEFICFLLMRCFALNCF